ncbi:MAG: hypothetical protein H6Q02_59 [Acidobacteria bacterium]|nr:hypothetical protein [Acidobacteriota bacterium]
MTPDTAPRRDRLLLVTAAYLALPNLLFVLGWLLPGWAALGALALAAALVVTWHSAADGAHPLSQGTVAAVALSAAAAAFAAGIGGLTLQVTDYYKHNLMFLDLAVERWPVVYSLPGGGHAYLCYYVAYYLPPGLVGTILSAGGLDLASLAWGLLGVGLAFAWVARLGRDRPVAVLILFLLVDGFAWLPGLLPLAARLGLLDAGALAAPWPGGVFSDRFWSFGGPASRLLFPGQLNHLVWTPQHALPGWLATACVLDTLERRRPAVHLPSIHAFTVLWSPFVAVGLVPFTALALLRERRRAVIVAGALAVVVALPATLYFAGHVPLAHAGWLFGAFAGWRDWLRYVAFLVLSVGVWWGLLAVARQTCGVPDRDGLRIAGFAAAVLVAITTVRIGLNNDWVLHVSSPALVVVHLAVARTATAAWPKIRRRGSRLLLVVLLFAGAERSVKHWVLAPLGLLPGQVIDAPIAEARAVAPNIATLEQDDYLAAQYLGRTDSFFARVLMRRPAAGPR